MKQAHLRSCFVQALWHFTPEMRKGKQSTFFNVFLREPTSMQHMAPALINYFMDIEDADFYARGHRYA